MDTYWYESRRVEHNPLETFMKELCKDVKLENKYTNHSIRSTCISKLDECGFEGRHITAISSHKSESTIKQYSVKCPERKRKEMFDALAELVSKKNDVKKEINNPEVTIASPITTPVSPKDATFSIDIPVENANLPALNEIDFLEMDNTDNQLLVDILTQTEKSLDQLQIPIQSNITNVQQNVNRPTPVVPRMYFPHSNANL